MDYRDLQDEQVQIETWLQRLQEEEQALLQAIRLEQAVTLTSATTTTTTRTSNMNSTNVPPSLSKPTPARHQQAIQRLEQALFQSSDSDNDSDSSRDSSTSETEEK